MGSLISVQDFHRAELESLLQRAQQFVEYPFHFTELLQNRCVANLFFENSTRTRFSFEVAEKRLGAQVLNFQDSTSSMQKGETIYDTLKTLEAMEVDAAVIRHSQNGLLDDLKDRLHIGLINAGIGNEEHPTQGLLDMLTIQQEFDCIKGIKVAIIGDLQHSRVARSNYYGLKLLGAEILYSGPEAYQPEDPEMRAGGTWLPIDDAIGEADVVMMLRVQHERHLDQKLMISQKEYHTRYGLTEDRARFMKKNAIIMHPAPVNRDVEIASRLVESPRSRIFKQINNGVSVRMAVLEHALL